jgi:hypothetical protein
VTTPPYHQNQFGATLGFPLLKNRLFFFGDTQATRITYAVTSLNTVPTALMREGNFTELLNTSLTGSVQPIQLYQPNSGGTATLSCNGQNNVFCPGQINPLAQNILNLYPLPNTNGGMTYNNEVENLVSTSNTYQWDTRLDWIPSSRDQAFARLSYSNSRGYMPPPFGTVLNGSTSYEEGAISGLIRNGVLTETHIFNPNLSNEFHFGVNYGAFAFLQPGYNTNVAASVGFGGIPYGPGWPDNGGLPQTSVGGISGFGAFGWNPSIENQDVYAISDNLTKIIGNHSLKFGVNFQSIRVSALQPPSSRGSYTYSGIFTSNLGASYTGSGIADFLADQMTAASITNETTISDVNWYNVAYAQDDWKVGRNLSLNLGLRYDYFEPPRENAGSQANFNVSGPLGVGTGSGVYLMPRQSQSVPLPSAFAAILAQNNITVQYLSNPALVNTQKMNFAPRIGFAYSPNSRTVLTGGFGVFYGGLETMGVGPNLGFNFPYGLPASFTRPNCAPNNCPSIPQTLETGFSTALDAGLQNYISLPSLNGTPEDSKITNTMSWNLAIRHSVMYDLVASIGYVGNISRHLGSYDLFNSPLALENPANNTITADPFPGIGTGGVIINYNGQSTYNSLQAKLEKRFANGVSFLSTYTWAHALDDSNDPNASYLPERNINLIPIRDEYTNSMYDIRHRFNFNGFYQLPFGKDRAYLNHGGWADVVAGGWAVDLTFSAQTGIPFIVSTDISTAAGGMANAIMIRNPFTPGGSPDPSNPGVTCAARTRTMTNWYNPCAFANPLPGTDIPLTGNGSQITNISQVFSYLGGKDNVIHGPGLERINLSLFKDFPVWRKQFLEFRADVFNVLNTPSYLVGITNDSSIGGQITGTQFLQNDTPDARFFQLSAKYKF